jgi:LAO/AO transport system kinase
LSPEEQALALITAARSGDERAVARLLRNVEDETDLGLAAWRRLFKDSGRARVIGITGPPGVGKSTLIGRLARAYRDRGQRVGVLAVDPTSPLTGGALLGDRIRMQELTSDPGVYIRSLATRGAVGGVARAAGRLVTVLDALGYEVVLLETVGAGQDEVEVATIAGTTVLVLMPGQGDEIQALKAGLVEVADIIVVNKADREGADQLAAQLRSVLRLGLRPEDGGWTPPIIKTAAADGTGLPELLSAIDQHQEYLSKSGEKAARRRAALRKAVWRELESLLLRRLSRNPEFVSEFEALVGRVEAGELDPVGAAALLLERLAAPAPAHPEA